MSIPVIIILFLVISMASGGAGYFYKKITSLHESGNDVPIVLMAAPVPLCVLFAVLASATGWQFDKVNMLCGLFGGIFFSAAVANLLISIRKGNYSISVIIINLSFFIPIVLSAVFLGESATALQIVGIVLLVLIIVFSNLNFKKSGEEKRSSNAWVIHALIACLCNGMVNFSLKMQQFYSPAAGRDTFYFVMYAVSLVIGVALFLCGRSARIKREHPFRIPLAAAALGLCVAFNYYPMTFLAANVNSALLFGVATAGAILMSLTAGWIFFGEKITSRGVISMVSCVGAIILQVISI